MAQPICTLPRISRGAWVQTGTTVTHGDSVFVYMVWIFFSVCACVCICVCVCGVRTLPLLRMGNKFINSVQSRTCKQRGFGLALLQLLQPLAHVWHLYRCWKHGSNSLTSSCRHMPLFLWHGAVKAAECLSLPQREKDPPRWGRASVISATGSTRAEQRFASKPYTCLQSVWLWDNQNSSALTWRTNNWGS